MNERASKGHNENPMANPEVQEVWANYKKLDEDAKAISATKRELRVTLKEKFGVPITAFTAEYNAQKLAPDERAARESAQGDLRVFLGYSLESLLAGEIDPNEDPIEAAKRVKASEGKKKAA